MSIPLSDQELDEMLSNQGNGRIPADADDCERLLDTAQAFREDIRHMRPVVDAARAVLRLTTSGPGEFGQAIENLAGAFESYDRRA